MKKKVVSILLVTVALFLAFGIPAVNVHAEEEENNDEMTIPAPKTSLTLKPVSKTLQISPSSTYDGSFSVSNDGDSDTKVEVHASPYSYVYSDQEDVYKLGFNHENDYTQIARWITIKNSKGEYVKNPEFTIKAGDTLNLDYRITTPSSIPAGGQYAAIFVQTITERTSSSGIQTEASAGMVVYGHSTEGEATTTSEIRDMQVGIGTFDENEAGSSHFYGMAKVKDTGNVDFFAHGELKVEPIIGFASYSTEEGNGIVSVIPESERPVQDEWKETPSFGIYKVTWTVIAGENTESIEQIFFLISPLAIIITIIVLTAIVMFVIMVIRKRKERRSRLAV